ESHPGGQSTQVACAQQSQREANFAAGGPRRELAEGHQIGVAVLVYPLPPAHVLIVEIPEMRDRPPERRQSQLRRHPKDLAHRAHASTASHLGGVRGGSPVTHTVRLPPRRTSRPGVRSPTGVAVLMPNRIHLLDSRTVLDRFPIVFLPAAVCAVDASSSSTSRTSSPI